MKNMDLSETKIDTQRELSETKTETQKKQIYECLFNSVFVFFHKVLESKVGILSIKKNTATFSIFIESNQNFFTINQIKEFVMGIKSIAAIDESVSKGVGDIDPVYDYERNCLYYQARNKITTIEAFKAGLDQIWPKLSYSKRSNSIKLVIN